MSVLETIGLFWVILATALFTAGVMIAAVWSIILGLTVVLSRYKLGHDMERTMREPEAQRAER